MFISIIGYFFIKRIIKRERLKNSNNQVTLLKFN